jgi:hypothetical protein
MANRPIQEQFGSRVIEAFASFAREDLDDPTHLEATTFAHVSDARLRRELSQVFYGARWIYKLGLALLTKSEERAAHVRAQIVDYAAVCEALLSYCVSHAIQNGYMRGTLHQWVDPVTKLKPIAWNITTPDRQLSKQSMWWLAKVALDSQIISSGLESELQWLREQRNTVHLRARASLGPTAFLNQSKRAFEATVRAIDETKAWKVAHP